MSKSAGRCHVRKGTNGVSTNGVTANVMLLTYFLGTAFNLPLYSQKWQGVPFPQSVKINYFCSGPIWLSVAGRGEGAAARGGRFPAVPRPCRR